MTRQHSEVFHSQSHKKKRWATPGPGNTTDHGCKFYLLKETKTRFPRNMITGRKHAIQAVWSYLPRTALKTSLPVNNAVLNTRIRDEKSLWRTGGHFCYSPCKKLFPQNTEGLHKYLRILWVTMKIHSLMKAECIKSDFKKETENLTYPPGQFFLGNDPQKLWM